MDEGYDGGREKYCLEHKKGKEAFCGFWAFCSRVAVPGQKLAAEIAPFGPAHAAVDRVGVERALGDEVLKISARGGTADADQFGHVLGAASVRSGVFERAAHLGQSQPVDALGQAVAAHGRAGAGGVDEGVHVMLLDGVAAFEALPVEAELGQTFMEAFKFVP